MFVNIFMPRKPKINRTEDKHKEVFRTQGQRVVNGGTEIVMENGRRFKRTVLPSAFAPISPQDIVEDVEDVETEAMSEEDLDL
jgi:hypothetical protein